MKNSLGDFEIIKFVGFMMKLPRLDIFICGYHSSSFRAE